MKARTNAFWSNTRQRIRNQIATYGRPVDITNMKYDRFRAARALGKRSGFEVRVCKELDDLHIAYKYEEITLPYIRPEEHTRYTPDLTFPNGLVIELKGRWETADRKKTRLIREQHPDVDLRMVFQNPSSRISKLSKTTYADICEKLGIKYAKQRIPLEWLQEPINHKSIAAMEAAQLCHRSSIAKRQSI